MADAVLSIVLERLVSVVQQMIKQEVRLVVGVKEELIYLTDVLPTIRDVVADAENRQVTEKDIKVWLERLKDMAYKMDDVFDEWNTAILELRIDSLHKRKVSSCSIIPSPCICFKQVDSRRDIAVKIKDIKQQLHVIVNERPRFDFALSRIEERPQRLRTTSVIDISEVCGRDKDLDTILDHLLGRSCQEKSAGLYIVSMVGTGGMGKTTLAQLAYNRPEVKAHFDERIWLCVSHPFDQIRVSRDIVEALQKQPCNLHDFEALQQKIQTCIAGKKFLLVLDDVWTEDHQLWEPLKNTLTRGTVESRILVTTRKDNVAKMMGTTYKHPIGELSPQHAQVLFHQIAFSGKSREKGEELQKIGEKIADKCKGLPLAIKTLGNLMRSKNSKEEWENVLDGEVWKLDVFEKDISPSFLLSYNDLPPAIKCCFSFCAIFPKDSVIEIDKLIQLWMAQSYLDTSGEMETVGREFFEHLADRSFFQDFQKDEGGNIIACKMHDIVHDFAQFLINEECFTMEVDNQKEWSVDLSFQHMDHATFIVEQGTPKFVSICDVENLRTLLVEEAFNSRVLKSLGQLTCLRALDLSNNESIKELPDEVGKLVHLRYLNLSYCEDLRELPETICDLYNLQTFNIQQCLNLRKLPQAMGKLISLRYLNLSYCEDLRELPETISDLYSLQTFNIQQCLNLRKLPQAMGKLISLRHLQNLNTINLKGLPKGIGRLHSLQTLEDFIVSSDGDDECKIGDLRNLNNLRGSLQIEWLDEVKDAEEAKKAELKNKEHLHHLSLIFGLKEGTRDVVEALQPHQNLKSLLIFSYSDGEWPNWMMGWSSLPQLKQLELVCCRECPCLPPLGQLPVLEKLIMRNMDGMKYIGAEFLGSSSSSSTVVFPNLKALYLEHMDELEQWEIKEEEGKSIMPRLNHLRVCNCPKLGGLPDHVLQRTPLQKLDITDSPILQQRYQKDIEEA